MTTVPWWVWGLVGGVLGSVIASFLAVVGERVPRGEPLGGRSHCACGRQLRAWENVPVAGWLQTRGRARCCGARLPVRYVLVEVGLGLAWGGLAASGLGVVAVTLGMLASAGVALGACWVRPALEDKTPVQ